MKIYKLLISTLFGVILATLGITAFSAYADNTATMYAELRCIENDDNHLRVDIYLDNASTITTGGFHVTLGSGLEFVRYTEPESWAGLVWAIEDSETYAYQMNGFEYSYYTATGDVFVCFAKINSYNVSVHKPLTSFYVRIKNSNSDVNRIANVYLMDSDFICDNNISHNYEIDTINMTESVKYMLGDTDGDYDVDSSDSYNINYALAYCPYPYYFNISDIESTFTQYFPNALDSYALDPNCNGTVSNSDAVAINQYIAAGNTYNGNIWKIFYHCYYL